MTNSDKAGELEKPATAAGQTGFALLYALLPFLKKEPAYAPDTIDYGYGYKGRKLCDGRYVLEKDGTNRAIDLESHNFTWDPDDVYYGDCIAPSAKALDKIAKSAMAVRGV